MPVLNAVRLESIDVVGQKIDFLTTKDVGQYLDLIIEGIEIMTFQHIVDAERRLFHDISQTNNLYFCPAQEGWYQGHKPGCHRKARRYVLICQYLDMRFLDSFDADTHFLVLKMQLDDNLKICNWTYLQNQICAVTDIIGCGWFWQLGEVASSHLLDMHNQHQFKNILSHLASTCEFWSCDRNIITQAWFKIIAPKRWQLRHVCLSVITDNVVDNQTLTLTAGFMIQAVTLNLKHFSGVIADYNSQALYALCQNTYLTSLDIIVDVIFGDSEVFFNLGAMLQQNQTLKYLKIETPSKHDVWSLSCLLAKNRHLIKVVIRHNFYHDLLSCFADAMCCNQILQSLKLKNYFEHEIYHMSHWQQRFRQMLATNRSLQTLQLPIKIIAEDLDCPLADILATNHTLQKLKCDLASEFYLQADLVAKSRLLSLGRGDSRQLAAYEPILSDRRRHARLPNLCHLAASSYVVSNGSRAINDYASTKVPEKVPVEVSELLHITRCREQNATDSLTRTLEMLSLNHHETFGHYEPNLCCF